MKKFEPKNISDATPDELRRYASEFLGLPIDGNSDAEVLAKVKAANDGDIIYVSLDSIESHPGDQSGAPPPKPEEGGGLVGSFGHADPRVKLTLHAEDRDGVVVNRHKEVGVNGVVWLLKRGESIEIPYRVFLALDAAEREVITHDDKGVQHSQRVKNTPFNVERMPNPEEISAWHKRVDSLFVP